MILYIAIEIVDKVSEIYVCSIVPIRASLLYQSFFKSHALSLLYTTCRCLHLGILYKPEILQ